MKVEMLGKGWNKKENSFEVFTDAVGLKKVMINRVCYVVPEQVANLIDGLFDMITELQDNVDKAKLDQKKQIMDRSVSIAFSLFGGRNNIYGENLMKKELHDDSLEGFAEFYGDVIARVQHGIEGNYTLAERGETVEHTVIVK